MILMEWIQEAIKEGQIIALELLWDNIYYSEVPYIEREAHIISGFNDSIGIIGITKRTQGKHETIFG